MKNISLIHGFIGILFSFLLFGTSCKTSQVAQQVDGSFAAKEKALLWKISGKNLKKASYLYGTIHMIGEDDFFMPDYVSSAFDKSEKIIFEINTDDMTDMSMMASLMDMMFMPEGTTLKDLYSEEDYKKVQKKLSGNPMMAMMGEMAERIKPLFLSSMIEQEGMDMGSGNPFMGGGGGGMKSYEMEFTEMAKKAKKPIDGLETVEYQMSMFDSITLEDQAKMLLEAIDAPKDEKSGENPLDMLVKLYKQQDVAGLYQIIHEQSASTSDFMDKFLTVRNKNWIPKMKEMMPQRVTFFAVGAGHLGGEEGVIALLRKEGYIVTPIKK